MSERSVNSSEGLATTPVTTRRQIIGLGATALGCGALAAGMAAPFIAIVDKAITSNASGREPLWTCMGNGFKMLVKQPGKFVRQPSFLWICFVYTGTYWAANLTHLACDLKNVEWQYPKFLATSAANVGLSVLKDRAFAKMFAAGGAAVKSVPVKSMVLFAARDSMTVFASFNLPPIVTPMVENMGIPHSVARAGVQVATPLLMQIFSVPLHLHALDCFNRGSATPAQRVSFVKQEYTKTLLARWMRIGPAFGIAGVVNTVALEQSRKFFGIEEIAGPDHWTKH